MLPSLPVDLQCARDAVVRLGPDINSLRASALTSLMPCPRHAPVWTKFAGNFLLPTRCERLAKIRTGWLLVVSILIKWADWGLVVEEQDAGVLSKLMSKSDVDARFGKGNWRAIRRGTFFQPSINKWRRID
eukprot:12412466-Karenia_brevis.AAC.1